MKKEKKRNKNEFVILSDEETGKIIRNISAVGIGGNIVLSAFKLFAGIAGNSVAMISDAVHSLSDVFATFIALIGAKVSRKGADKEHPYGHERMECVASILLAGILVITGAGIGWVGIRKIFEGNYSDLEVPGILPLIAAAVSIIVKEGMYWYTRHYAKKIQSDAFMADAWHHRSDAFSSIGALIGIGGARLGAPVLDPVASVVIAAFIIKVAYNIFVEAIRKMTDQSCEEAEEEGLRRCIEEDPDVRGIDMLRTRAFGNRVYVDVEIRLDGEIRLREADEIAERVHDRIEQQFPNVKHIMVHVNPD